MLPPLAEQQAFDLLLVSLVPSAGAHLHEKRTQRLTRPTTSRTRSAGSHTSYSVFIGRFWETFLKMHMVVFLLIILIYT